MKQGSRLIQALPVLLLGTVLVAGCARDGAFETRGGSIKDQSLAREDVAPAARSASRPAPPKQRVVRAQAPKEEALPAPVRQAQQAVPPPATTSTLQVMQPQVPQGTPPAARRPAVNGAQLLEEGRSLFRAGEVLAARERYVAALSAPLPEVLLELARTYDPNYLDRLPKSDADADIDRARALYEQAVTLGSRAAEADLARLQGRANPPR